MKVIAHPLPEVYNRKHGKLNDLRTITHDPKHRQEWLSTTTVRWHPGDGYVYLGLTQMDGDIFYRFDRETGEAECLDYLSIRVNNEVKIHRSLEIAPDGRMIGASAGLITLKERETAPGGQIWSFDPQRNSYDVFGIPSPGDYVQHITVDFKRMVAYGCTYPVPWFFAFDLNARKTIRRVFIGAYPHKSGIDDKGRVWTGYSATADVGDGENYLMCYDPDENTVEWTDLQLPAVGRKDDKQMDDIVNFGDGYLYIGSVSGGFSRLDPENRKIEWLGKPARGMRLCGIDEGPDGDIYVTTGANYGMKGEDGVTRAHRFDRKTKQFIDLGPIYDPEFGSGCFALHALSVDDSGTLWVGETDNSERSGCLWECRVK